ncbi:hypothetical protein NNC19_17890 [Clostridium sp. SHJSY1]|uniref:hypothetical protein n=1 Tax=Clostridium sp. SHJSY1 TaxID=2942483 RepID=UPI002876AA27|nr:hypothetical protein [Clostridium sp. SHJSY1]MDS0527566.1 hypothetical protein [Clostridium sp. SHJSY1]
MDYNYQNERIGGGIITICVLYFIGLVLTILGAILTIAMKDFLAKQGVTISPITLYISIIILVITCIGAILILKKQKLGIAIYYIGILASLINSIVMNGFRFSLIIDLILPIIMAILLNNKKQLFGFENK